MRCVYDMHALSLVLLDTFSNTFVYFWQQINSTLIVIANCLRLARLSR